MMSDWLPEAFSMMSGLVLLLHPTHKRWRYFSSGANLWRSVLEDKRQKFHVPQISPPSYLPPSWTWCIITANSWPSLSSSTFWTRGATTIHRLHLPAASLFILKMMLYHSQEFMSSALILLLYTGRWDIYYLSAMWTKVTLIMMNSNQRRSIADHTALSSWYQYSCLFSPGNLVTCYFTLMDSAAWELSVVETFRFSPPVLQGKNKRE